MGFDWVEHHPDRNPVSQKTPDGGPERNSPVPRHHKPDNHLEHTKEHPNQRTDMPNKVNFLLPHFQEHPHHQTAVTFHLAHHHFTHVNQ